MKDDLVRFVKEFYVNLTLPKAYIVSFLALIPKSVNPTTLHEYRTICLVESLYRILKLCASKLKKVMSNMISSCQTIFFLPKIQMLDRVVVINDLVDYVKRHKRSCMMVKIYIEKAYDCVSWDFLRDMIRKMKFGSK